MSIEDCAALLFEKIDAPGNRAFMDQAISELRSGIDEVGEVEALHVVVHAFDEQARKSPRSVAVIVTTLMRELARQRI